MLRYLGLFMIVCFLNCTPKKETQIEQEIFPKWESIFNGKNIEGWTPKIVGFPLGENFGNTFSVSDGILKVRYDSYGDDFDSRFGGLYFDRILKNYRFKVEYRFVGETAPGAPEWGFRDSGIQYLSQSPKSLTIDQPFPICLEYNFHGGDGKEERPTGAICANGTHIEIDGKKNENYCTPATVKTTIHGDEWVTAEIEIKDGVIKHFVNGKEILSFNNPILNPENEISKTLIHNGENSLTEGYLSFQSNSHPFDIRKVELLEY